jgi:hypothetical protein
MTTLLDEVEATTSTSPASRLRQTSAAVRVSFTWFGARKALTPEQRSLAAESFGAEGAFLSAGKKIIDTKHPAFRAVTNVRGRIIAFWKGATLPFPEGGVRLLPQDRINEFDAQMKAFRQVLDEAVMHLDNVFSELKAAARRRLGSLFDPADYPQSLQPWFKVDWDYPSVQAPDYLRQLNPRLYEEECRRAASRFDEAVQLAEQAFTEEFARLVGHLTERISGTGGEKKVFRDSAVSNLIEFFERFRSLNVRSNEELDRLVEQSRRLVQGVEAEQLRRDEPLRQRLASDLSRVQASLDGLLVDRPRRRLLRSAVPPIAPGE